MKKLDPSLRIAVAALILAAAAYLGAAMFADGGTEAVPSESTAKSTVTLKGVVLRDELAVFCDGDLYFVAAEGEFVPGGEVICVPSVSRDDYFAAIDSGKAYEGDCVRAPTSGYFCTDLDGLEDADPEDYPRLREDSVDGAVCRIVYGASWYYVAADKDGDFTEGETVTLKLRRSYTATVQSAEDGVVVFRVREGLYSVLSLRYETATVLR